MWSFKDQEYPLTLVASPSPRASSFSVGSKLGSGHIHILACKKGKERKSCISNGKSASNSERTVMNLRRIKSLLLVGVCA